MAAFTYDPVGRIISTAVTHSGVGNLDDLGRTKPDGGNRTLHYYFSGGRNIEVRNADLVQTLAQHVYDAGGSCPIFTDVNGDPEKVCDSDPDSDKDNLESASPPTGDDAPDSRYFYHYDAAGRLAAITGYTEPAGKGGTDGAVWSRIAYTPNGPLYLNNDDNGQELNAPSNSPPADYLSEGCYFPVPDPIPEPKRPPGPAPDPNPCAHNNVDGREVICWDGGNPQFNPATGNCECGGGWTPPISRPPIYIPGGGGGGGHPGGPAPWGPTEPNGPGTGGPGDGGPNGPGGGSGCGGAASGFSLCTGEVGPTPEPLPESGPNAPMSDPPKEPVPPNPPDRKCDDCWQTCLDNQHLFPAKRANGDVVTGAVVCREDGCRCACLNERDVREFTNWGNPDHMAWRKCTLLHEEEHVKQSGNCHCSPKPCLMNIMWAGIRECKAHKVSLACMATAIENCRKKIYIDCSELEFLYERERTMANRRYWCGFKELR